MKLPRLLRSIGVYTLLGFAPLAVNFFLLPLYTAKLDPHEFGVLTAANVSFTFASLFIALGIESGYARLFFDHWKTPDTLSRLIASVLMALAGTTAGLVVLLGLFGTQIFSALWGEASFARFGWLVVLGAIVQVLYSIIYSHHRNYERLSRVASLSLLGSVCSVGGATLAVLFWRADALAAFAGRIVGSAAVTFPFLGMWLGEMGSFRPSRSMLRALFSYSLPIFAYSLVAYVLFNGDRILMERLFSLHALGLYALASTITSPIEMVLQAGQQAVQPSFYRQLDARDPRAPGLVSGFYNANVLIAIIGSVLLILLSEHLLLLFRGTKFLGAVRYLPLLCLAQLARVMWTGYAFFIFYSKKTTVLPIVTGLSIVAGLAGALGTRGALGDLCVAFGVLCWKSAQLLLTAAAVARFSPGHAPSYRPVLAVVGLLAGYVIVLQRTAEGPNGVVALSGGLVLVASCGVLLWLNLRSGWWTEARTHATSPSPAEAA